MKTREESLGYLKSNIQNENLIKHCLAVEAAMRHYAKIFGEDQEKWGIAGLLHDIDYEKYPTIDAHSLEGAKMLEAQGYEADIVKAVKSHNRHHGIPIETLMEKTLLAVDELTGLVTASALVRPSKSVMDMEASSVKKKMKDKAFAKNVSREEIIMGAEMIGKPLDEHIKNVIEAMRSVAKELGL